MNHCVLRPSQPCIRDEATVGFRPLTPIYARAEKPHLIKSKRSNCEDSIENLGLAPLRAGSAHVAECASIKLTKRMER